MKIEAAPTAIICAACGALLVSAHHPRYECRSTEMCELHKSMHMPDLPEQHHHRLPPKAAPIIVSSTATSTLGSTLWWSPGSG